VSKTQILGIYRLLFVALIVIGSIQGLLVHWDAHDHGAALAITELAGALMLIGQRTRGWGALLLLGVFAVAQLAAALAGHWPIHYLQYAASTLLIVFMDGRESRADPMRPPAVGPS
jgi:hypothetical protein